MCEDKTKEQTTFSFPEQASVPTRSYHVMAIHWHNVGMDYDSLPDGVGVYQLYGDSEIYGPDVLLYIGQSEHLRSRIRQHIEGITQAYHIQNIRIRAAICDKSDRYTIESILIAHCKPSRNANCLMSVTEKQKYVLLHNHGDKGVLPLEMTNTYWVESEDPGESQESVSGVE